MKAIRQGDWKYVQDDMVEMLFNLKDDIGETKDLSKAMPDKVAELRKMLHTWRQDVDAKMMSPNPNFKERQK